MGDHWYNKLDRAVASGGAMLADGAEVLADETPGIGTIYHGAQSVYHTGAALGTVAAAELTGDDSPETQNVAVNEASEAGAHAIESIPFLGMALDGADLVTGGDVHDGLKKEIIDDTMGAEYDKAPESPEAQHNIINTVGNALFRPWMPFGTDTQ